MATPPASLVAVAEAVARLHDSNDHAIEALKKIGTASSPGIKSLWGRLVRGRPAVTLQRAVTLAQLAHLHTRNALRSRSSPLIWVDDRPANNAKEAQQLKSLGLDVKQVTTTAEALAIATEGSYFVTDSFRPDDGLDHAAAELIRSIRAVPSLASSPVLIYVGAEPLDLVDLMSASPPVLISNNPTVLEEFANCLLPHSPPNPAPANPNPNPKPAAVAAASVPTPPASPCGSVASSSSASSSSMSISTASASFSLDNPDEPMLEKAQSRIDTRKRSRDEAEIKQELKQESFAVPAPILSKSPSLKSHTSHSNASSSVSSSAPQPSQSGSAPASAPAAASSTSASGNQLLHPSPLNLKWQLQGTVREGNKCTVSVTIPPDAPALELSLIGQSIPRTIAFHVPQISKSGSGPSAHLYHFLPIAAGNQTLELRRGDQFIYSSHPITVLPYAPPSPPSSFVAPSAAPVPAAAKSTSVPALAETTLRSSDPLSLLEDDDVPSMTRRKPSPNPNPPDPGTPPLPTEPPAKVARQTPAIEEEDDVKTRKDDASGGTEEIPELNGTLPLPSDEGADDAKSRSSPQPPRSPVTATVPLPD